MFCWGKFEPHVMVFDGVQYVWSSLQKEIALGKKS